jgi:ribosomal protein L30E
MDKLYYSFLQYTQLVDRYARQRRRNPEFELRQFFGQLKRLLVLELPTLPQFKLTNPTTIILAVIQNVKTSLDGNIQYYKELGVVEIVDLTTVQSVVGRIHDRGKWAIIDRGDNQVMQVTCKFFLSSYPIQLSEFFVQPDSER